MPYRELIMVDIKEMLRRRAAGQSARHVARETGFDRKTVGRYFEAAATLPLPPDREPTDEEIHAIAQRVQSRPVPDASEEWKEIGAHRARIEAWLAQPRPLKLTKIHTLLKRDHGVSASYDTLRRFAMEELAWRKKTPTVRVADTEPGEVAQIDFGLMGKLFDPATQRVRNLWVLVVTLAYSRYQFVWPSFEQTTAAVCAGLDAAWRFFGAMARVILPDNMKAIVLRADELAPVLVPAFLDYAQTRGLLVDAARVRSPQDKARVENQVAYVRESWFDGESFTSLDEARASAERWCRDVAGARVHGTTREVPREVFEARERTAMKPAPTAPFDVPHWTDAKVHPDHHVQVLRSLYSVPTRYVGSTVRVRADSVSVRIYAGTQLVKVHARVTPGKRSTDPSDYPVGKDIAAERDVASLIASAKKCGVHVGIYAERLLDVPLPWTRMRLVYALLRLCNKFGNGRVEAICQSALAFDVVDVQRVARMLETAKTPASPPTDERKVVALPTPRFARSTEHFATRTLAAAATKEEA
ncbi:transposase [Sorangium cellulosum]|uniref:Transposase n=1 Tax=Sorangium cellulosum TaxID=56 RepID=A0A2L0F303_SORCE|nr:IS21 family transposase [Sorangium cellulosum]AUX45913.1 transposase [Sorangium cellulosum]